MERIEHERLMKKVHVPEVEVVIPRGRSMMGSNGRVKRSMHVRSLTVEQGKERARHWKECIRVVNRA